MSEPVTTAWSVESGACHCRDCGYIQHTHGLDLAVSVATTDGSPARVYCLTHARARGHHPPEAMLREHDAAIRRTRDAETPAAVGGSGSTSGDGTAGGRTRGAAGNGPPAPAKPDHDPELYARMAAPYPSAEAASEALQDFADALMDLREAHRIPELVVSIAAHWTDADGQVASSVISFSRGSGPTGARLAAMAYQRFALPEIERARELERIARGEAATLPGPLTQEP